MQKAKHTPEPWNVMPESYADADYFKLESSEYYNSLEVTIGNAYGIHEDERPDLAKEGLAIAEANAEFICKAVNCHDTLVAALVETRKQLLNAGRLDERGNYTDCVANALEQADAALDKATAD